MSFKAFVAEGWCHVVCQTGGSASQAHVTPFKYRGEVNAAV